MKICWFDLVQELYFAIWVRLDRRHCASCKIWEKHKKRYSLQNIAYRKGRGLEFSGADGGRRSGWRNTSENIWEIHLARSEKFSLQKPRNTLYRKGRGEFSGADGWRRPGWRCFCQWSTCCSNGKASHANVGINAREVQGENFEEENLI